MDVCVCVCSSNMVEAKGRSTSVCWLDIKHYKTGHYTDGMCVCCIGNRYWTSGDNDNGVNGFYVFARAKEWLSVSLRVFVSVVDFGVRTKTSIYLWDLHIVSIDLMCMVQSFCHQMVMILIINCWKMSWQNAMRDYERVYVCLLLKQLTLSEAEAQAQAHVLLFRTNHV